MSTIQGAPRPRHRRSRDDRLDASSTSSSRPGRHGSTCSTTSFADVATTSTTALASGRGGPRRGRPPRPRPRPRPHLGERPRLPPGGHPDHPVRRGAPARTRGARRRHVQRPRGRRRAPGRQAGRWPPRHRSTALPRSSRPPSATTTTTTTPSTARPSRSTRAWRAASGRCPGSTTSRCATSTSTARGWTSTASTPRCWCAGWSASPTGSRRSSSATACRRWTSSTPSTSPGPTSWPMELRRPRGRLQHRQQRRDLACSAWPRRCCARWTPTSTSSTGPSARSTA